VARWVTCTYVCVAACAVAISTSAAAAAAAAGAAATIVGVVPRQRGGRCVEVGGVWCMRRKGVCVA
jgi:hypothetical protein